MAEVKRRRKTAVAGIAPNEPERDILDQYLYEVSTYPLLKGTEEIEVARRIRAGDPDALQELVQRNLRFVISVAKKYQNRGMPLIDLIGEGMTNRQIAERLGISENGVKRHLSNLFTRYDVESRAALVHQALGANSEEERLFGLLRSTLADVLGQPATDVLLRRAAGTAALPDEASEIRISNAWTDGDTTRVTMPELLEQLWRVLFATTGEVVTRRLERAGFHSGPGTRMEERQP